MRAFLCCFALLLVPAACGGGGAGAGEPKSAASEDGSDHDAAGTHGEDGDSASEASSTPDKPRAASCDDGTCSVCGSGICPTGWYCDEKVSACSWLAECAEKPTCGCVTRVLGSACKCHEEGGGLKVACD